MPEQRVFESQEDKVFLTFDFDDDFSRSMKLIRDLGQRVHAVKLGQPFLLDERWPQFLKWLKDCNVETFLDLPMTGQADRMCDTAARIAALGFSYASVEARVETDSLLAVARAAGNLAIVAMLSYSPESVREEELERIQQVNKESPDGQGVGAVMCNVSQLQATLPLGERILRVATGIRMPGDSPDDHPFVAEPYQALEWGADMLAIGRTVTDAENMQYAYEGVLENMSLAA